jgi:hypothetical protein
LHALDDDDLYNFVRRIQSVEKDSLQEIIMIFYLRIGRNHFRNLFKNLSVSDFIQYFRGGTNFGRQSAVSLMNEILQVQQCSIQELEDFDDAFVNLLLDEIEAERDNEEYSYGMLKLLVS